MSYPENRANTLRTQEVIRITHGPMWTRIAATASSLQPSRWKCSPSETLDVLWKILIPTEVQEKWGKSTGEYTETAFARTRCMTTRGDCLWTVVTFVTALNQRVLVVILTALSAARLSVALNAAAIAAGSIKMLKWKGLTIRFTSATPPVTSDAITSLRLGHENRVCNNVQKDKRTACWRTVQTVQTVQPATEESVMIYSTYTSHWRTLSVFTFCCVEEVYQVPALSVICYRLAM